MSEQPNSRSDEIYRVVSLIAKVRAAKEILRGTWPEDDTDELLQTVKFSLKKLDEILSDKYYQIYQRENND